MRRLIEASARRSATAAAACIPPAWPRTWPPTTRPRPPRSGPGTPRHSGYSRAARPDGATVLRVSEGGPRLPDPTPASERARPVQHAEDPDRPNPVRVGRAALDRGHRPSHVTVEGTTPPFRHISSRTAWERGGRRLFTGRRRGIAGSAETMTSSKRSPAVAPMFRNTLRSMWCSTPSRSRPNAVCWCWTM